MLNASHQNPIMAKIGGRAEALRDDEIFAQRRERKRNEIYDNFPRKFMHTTVHTIIIIIRPVELKGEEMGNEREWLVCLNPQ
jgi:hypothetical protein